jgi:hypothetical protein
VRLSLHFDSFDEYDTYKDADKYLNALVYLQTSLQEIKQSDDEKRQTLHIEHVISLYYDALSKAGVDL